MTNNLQTNKLGGIGDREERKGEKEELTRESKLFCAVLS
jgi:hypothetical protein